MSLLTFFSRRATPELSPLLVGRQTLLWLTLSYLLLVIPLYPQLNLFIYLVAIGTISGRYIMHMRQLPPPRRLLLNTLAIVSGLFIIPLWWYGGLLESMINLLVLGTSLKFLEFHEKRDMGIHVLALFFLGGVLFIYHQEIWMAAYLLLTLLLCVVTLLSLYRKRPAPAQLAFTGKLLLQSLPLMLLLFVIMPRLAPFWQMPDAKLASTGLSERIAPEDISRLARSSERVFRATFAGEPPAARYWRVMVHEWFDGHSWNLSPSLASWLAAAKTPGNSVAGSITPPRWQGRSQRYTLMPDVNNQHWIYALERSTTTDNSLVLTPYLGLISRLPQSQARQFVLESHEADAPDQQLSSLERQLNLQLPESGNPKTRELALSLRAQSHSDAEVAARAMDFFRSQGLIYTLEPPPLTGDGIDQLLFVTKQGFCAHFASSFAFMMRVAGVPARLVSGYLGGEYDAAAHFLTVYQYDAHAWVEVWLDGHWQRFDPTLMVAPGRLGQGVSELVPDAAALTNGALSLNRYRAFPLVNEMRMLLAQIDFRWSVWVLNFTSDKQEQLLGKLWGKGLLSRLGVLLGGALLCVALAWLVHRLWQRAPKQDLLLRHYLEGCQLMASGGQARHHHETASQYAARLVAAEHPACTRFAEFTTLFCNARYQQDQGTVAQQMSGLLDEIKNTIKSNRYKISNKINKI